MADMTDDEMEKLMQEIEGNGSAPSAAAPVETSAIPDAPVEQPESVTPPDEKKVRVGHEVMLKRFIDPEKLRADVAINPNDLDVAMMEHAALYVHYATQTVNARRQYERLKNGFEILEARLDAEYRESLGAESAKKPTEAAIRNALVADKRWSGAQARVIEAQSIWKLCEVAESALCQRKDLILEVARDRRKEREGELVVRQNQSLRQQVMDDIAARASEKKTA